MTHEKEPKRCMGNPDNYAECMKCLRMPKIPEEEEAQRWVDWRKMVIPCRMFRKGT